MAIKKSSSENKAMASSAKSGTGDDHWAGPCRALADPTMETRTKVPLVGRGLGTGKLSLRELTEQTLLKLTAPTGALVNAHGDILYLHGRTGMYLEQVPSEDSTNNILKMAREGLRQELASALHNAFISGKIYRKSGIAVKSDGAFVTVNLTISPVVTGPVSISAAPLYLVIMEEVASRNDDMCEKSKGCAHSPEFDDNVCIAPIRQEVPAREEHLQTVHERLASANEELQSIYEDLQVTNEELLTLTEELLLVNEEFSAINGELQIKVVDLQRSKSDINNMLAEAGIGMLFIDRKLSILCFTLEVTKIINLVASDVGQSMGHIASNLVEHDCLVASTKLVLDTLVSKEIDVETTAGKWFSMRIQPCRLVGNGGGGAVITFVDITGKHFIGLH